MIYEVNIKVESQIAAQYAEFLKNHIPELLKIDGFESAEWWTEVDADLTSVLWVIHYRVKSRALLERYLAEDAPRMRAEAIARFGERFSIRRRILSPYRP
ncbi:MAG: DUF4286 family protein [Oligoflexia bacterium]